MSSNASYRFKVQIDSLIEKRDDEIKLNGKPHLSTLVKLNLAYSEKNLAEGELKESERYARQAFEYLHSSFEEALTIYDKELRTKVFHALYEQQCRLIHNFVISKVSFKNQIDVSYIETLHDEVKALITQQLFGRSARFSAYVEIMYALGMYMKKNKIYINDGGAIVNFIDSEMASYEDLDDERRNSIDWLKVRVFRQLVRQQRSQAYSSPVVASELSEYRAKSADLLMKLNQPEGYGEDYIESLVYKVIASKTKKGWSKQFRLFMEYAEDYREKQVISTNSVNRYYLRCYVRIFELTKSLPTKIEYLERILMFAEESHSVQRNFFLPLYYLLDLHNYLASATSIKNIKKYVDANHSHKWSKSGTFINDSHLIAADLYTDIKNLLFATDNEINNTNLKGLGSLWGDKVIPNENLFLQLLSRCLSTEIDKAEIMRGIMLASQVAEEEDSGVLTDIEKILVSDEGQRVEVKLSMESGVLKKIAQTICAFANENGGTVVIGLLEKAHFSKELPGESVEKYKIIANEFVVVGYKNFDRARTKLAATLKSKSSLDGSSIEELYTINLIKFNNRTIGTINVKPYANRTKQLLLYEGRPYRRYDNQTMEMSYSEVNSRMSRLFSSQKEI